MIPTSNPYVPILVIGAIGFGFAAFSVIAGALAGPARYNRAKLDAYECGIEPSPQAAEGGDRCRGRTCAPGWRAWFLCTMLVLEAVLF